MVVYHGTTQDFTTFSKDKLGSFTHAASAKLAFFATSNENLAKDIYAGLEDNEHERNYYTALMVLVIITLKINDEYVTLCFGDSKAFVIKKQNITDVIPEMREN